jgi:hypothetical protein
VTPALWDALRLLALSGACLGGAAVVAGWTVAQWQEMRDWQRGRNQPRPVWTAEDRWGTR